MAYQTSVVTSAADLKSTIETFAQANGWTLSGGVLNAGSVYVRLTNPDSSSIKIEGARNNTWSAPDICSRWSQIRQTVWPAVAKCELFAFGSPMTLWCRLNFDIVTNRHLGFGMITKYGTWNGGQWFHASHTQDSHAGDNALYSKTDSAQAGPLWRNETALFWDQQDLEGLAGVAYYGKCSMLECDLTGDVWPATTGAGTNATAENKIYSRLLMSPIHKYNPNLINNQSILTPFQLFLLNNDGNYMPIGFPDHVRWVRMDNYQDEDIVTIGSDRWKIFSWGVKDAVYPDGNTGASSTPLSTGYNGVAVRYDGP